MPVLGVKVRKEYLKNFKDGFGDYVNGRIFSIKSIKGKALLFDVHLENGAIYRGLPISAFCVDTNAPKEDLTKLEVYDAFSYDVSVIQYDYMKSMDFIILNKDGTKETGMYVCTIHNFARNSLVDSGYNEYPGEDKDFYMIEKDNGNFCIYPTNMLLAVDGSFTKIDDKNKPDLDRNVTNYYSERSFDQSGDGYLYSFKVDDD
jgi:hypothetical protein